MAKDPKEEREGMVLQYGHTVGHPIEHLSGYRLYHGEAISIGMMVAVRVSRIMGACTDELVRRHEELLGRYGLPTRIPRSIRVDDIIDALRYNKKYLVEGTRMALLTDVGKLWCVDGEHAIPVSDRVVAQAAGQCMEVIGGSSETREDERWNPSWQWSRERAAG
jgi:3-dehydroquinate synthase